MKLRAVKTGHASHAQSYLSLKALAKTSPAYICTGKASSDQIDTLQIEASLKSFPPFSNKSAEEM